MELYECINFVLNSTQNAVHSYFREQLQPLGVTPIQYSVLKCLWNEDQQTPTQLAQTLQVDSSTITGLLGRLEQKDLIARKYSKQDRRSVFVCLQPAGRALQKGVEDAIQAANVEITSGIAAEDLAKFKAMCKQMKDNARN